VNDYLLFLDSEASGVPKNWDLPYSVPDNWPYVVQISWLVYDRQGVKIKEEDHYIKDETMKLSADATRIHRLRKDFLAINGKCRHDVLSRLSADIARYEPRLVGHFLNLDLHLIGAECHRAGLENPTKGRATYCTMLGSKHLQPNPKLKYLKLADLYQVLFHEPQENAHDALADASATAACYFELRRTGHVREEQHTTRLHQI
jgi:DNA polymerase III subunit epsilon